MKTPFVISLALLCFAAFGLANVPTLSDKIHPGISGKSTFAIPSYAKPHVRPVLEARDQCVWCFEPSCSLLNDPNCQLAYLAYEDCMYNCYEMCGPQGCHPHADVGPVPERREIDKPRLAWRKGPDRIARLR